MADNLVLLKQEFYRIYAGNSHIQEFLPLFSSSQLPIDEGDLNKLHNFAKNNPIYHNSYELEVSGIHCRVYEGDINNYWINSLKHDSSYQPFYPTWILSAYLIALKSKNLGYEQLIDIGSGDGRIAYCGKVSKLTSHAIEIDQSLVDLQQHIISKTNIEFNATCFDATLFEYTSMDLSRPVFFIGGLPQMGEMLANSILSKINELPKLKKESCFVLAGTHSTKQFSGNSNNGGWDPIIKKLKLTVIDTVTIPTSWTSDQNIDTPYIFTTF